MEKFDVAVIGGGPAGLFAAGFAANNGARVLLIEKNRGLGEKLLLAGKRRCNITNAEEDEEIFLSRYGNNGKFLHSAFSQHSPKDTIEFFNSRGIKTTVERGKRVFPSEGDSSLVLKCLLSFCKEGKVIIYRDTAVQNMTFKDGYIERLLLQGGNEVEAGRYILATGGKSFPKTGSTGDGYLFAGRAGHTIITPRPVIVPIKTHETWVKLARVDLRNVALTAWLGDKKISEKFGEMEFAPFGISGPIVMDMSGEILDLPLLESGRPGDDGDKIVLNLDLKPAIDEATLIARVTREFEERGSAKFSNALRAFVPAQMIPIMLRLSDIPEDKPVQHISEEEILEFAQLLKGIKLHPSGAAGFNHAIVTRGGVSLKEVEPATMRSKICPNLYFAGEILDIDGPSGGFNLQNCWSTGFVAGNVAPSL